MEEVAKTHSRTDSEEKEWQNIRRNIIIFEFPESKKCKPDDRKEEDVIKLMGLCKNIHMVNRSNDYIKRAIRLVNLIENDPERQHEASFPKPE